MCGCEVTARPSPFPLGLMCVSSSVNGLDYSILPLHKRKARQLPVAATVIFSHATHVIMFRTRHWRRYRRGRGVLVAPSTLAFSYL